MRNALHIERFPDELHRKTKVLAAMEGITLRQAVTEAVNAWCIRVEENMRQPLPRSREETQDGNRARPV